MQHIKRENHRYLLFLVLISVLTTGLGASPREAHLIIVGPGDPLYTYWGHIGIAITDKDTGKSEFYDFGNFSFHSDNFYGDFAMGRMLYLGMSTPTDYFISYSMTEDRDLMAYPLNLGEKELDVLEARLEWWMLPENKEYLYDYFHSNCSTIIRDVLDEAVGGSLMEASGDLTGLSFRDLARTGSDPSVASEILLHFLLGPGEDYEISEWELMFLPQAVADNALALEYRSEDGKTRILAGEPEIFRESTREPVPENYRTLWPIMMLAGLILAGIWTVAGIHWKKRYLKISMTSLQVIISLMIGIPGLILGFLMFFTDHNAAYNNLNFWPAFPGVLAGLVPAIRKKPGDERVLSWIWTANLAGLIIVMLVRGLGFSTQDAFAFWAFFTPLLLTASRPGLLLREKLIRKED